MCIYFKLKTLNSYKIINYVPKIYKISYIWLLKRKYNTDHISVTGMIAGARGAVTQ